MRPQRKAELRRAEAERLFHKRQQAVEISDADILANTIARPLFAQVARLAAVMNGGRPEIKIASVDGVKVMED